ncbi:unnamed protein product [Amaranthus hypochondriacus]
MSHTIAFDDHGYDNPDRVMVNSKHDGHAKAPAPAPHHHGNRHHHVKTHHVAHPPARAPHSHTFPKPVTPPQGAIHHHDGHKHGGHAKAPAPAPHGHHADHHHHHHHHDMKTHHGAHAPVKPPQDVPQASFKSLFSNFFGLS